VSNEAVQAGRQVWKIVMVGILVSGLIQLIRALMKTIAGRGA
jgi:hypothetical protein